MNVDAQKHFDKIADQYKKAADTWESVYRKTREIIEPLIKDKTVLDIGNGGYFPYDTRLAKKVTVLDISPAMLEKIDKPNIEKKVGDARILDNIEDDSMDVILFVLCVHHINGNTVRGTFAVLDEVIAASRKKLKRGGVLVIVEPTLAWPLFAVEVGLFHLTKLLLRMLNVSMIFFFHVTQLRDHMGLAFGSLEAEREVIPLPIEGWIDPLGGSFPGRILLPAWLCPTRYFLLKVTK